jgi:hypothetical protein
MNRTLKNKVNLIIYKLIIIEFYKKIIKKLNKHL